MITKLYLRDFQSIKSNIPIEIKPLTILCGPNSAGKSCVYDALILLKNLFIQKVTDKTQEENIPYRGKKALDSYDLGVEFIFSLPEQKEENFTLFKSSAPSTTYDYFLRFFKGLSNYDDVDDVWLLQNMFSHLNAKRSTVTINLKGYKDKFYGKNKGDFDENFKQDLEILVDGELFFKINSGVNEKIWFDEYFQMHTDSEVPNRYFENGIRDGFVLLNGNHDLVCGIYDPSGYINVENYFGHVPKEGKRRTLEMACIDIVNGMYVFRGCKYSLEHGIYFSHPLPGWDHGKWHTTDLFVKTIIDNDDPESEMYRNSKKVNEYKKWLGEINDSIPDLTDDREFANKINDLIKGFTASLHFTINDFLQIPGHRGLLNSDKGYYEWRHITHKSIYDDGNRLFYNMYFDSDKSTKQFIELTEIDKVLAATCLYKDPEEVFDDNFVYEEIERWRTRKRIDNFVNDSLSRYMHSLNSYSLKFDSCKISGRNSKTVYFPMICDENKNIMFRFDQVGTGVSCLIPIFCALERNCSVLIEQPELHLHPKSQAEIGDVLIYWLNSKDLHETEKSVLIVETHSENLILRISRRIRESGRDKLNDKKLKISPNDAIIYYFEPVVENRSKNNLTYTRVHQIRFDSEGEFLDKWPHGFFAERQDEYSDE